MKHSSMKFAVAITLLVMNACTVSAALKGRIVDQSRAPLSNAQLVLPSARWSFSTGADGLFSFDVPTVLTSNALSLPLQSVTCTNGYISFTIAGEAKQVTINMFGLSGRQVASFSQKLSPGAYCYDALSVIKCTTSSGFYIAYITLNGRSYSYEISRRSNGRRTLYSNWTSNKTPISGLFKRESQVDVLEISRTGYQNMSIPVSSYDMNLGDITISAQSYVLKISSTPANGGTVTRNPNLQTYSYGTLVTLAAMPSLGYNFINWTGNASGTNPSTQITMTDNMNVNANFSLHILPKYTLAGTANPSIGGSVSLSPSGGTYDSGTVVTVMAAPSSGYTFSSWSGDISGASSPAQIAMTSNKSVTANFTPVPIITGPSSATAPFQISCTYNWISTLASNLDQLVLEYSQTSSISGFAVLSSSPAGTHPSSYNFSCIPQAGDVGNFYFRVHVIEAARTTGGYSNILVVNVSFQSLQLQITNDLHSGTSASGNNWTQLNTVIKVMIGLDTNHMLEVLAPVDVNCSLAGGNCIPPGNNQKFDVSSYAPNYDVFIQTGYWDLDANTLCWNKHLALVYANNGACCCYKWVVEAVKNQTAGVTEIKLSQCLPGGSYDGTY